MSRVLIAGICLEMPQIVDESMKELAANDENLAEMVASFDNLALIRECVQRTLAHYSNRAGFTVSDVIREDNRSIIRSFNGCHFAGVLNHEQISGGLGVVVDSSGKVEFGMVTSTPFAEVVQKEFVNLLLAETLQSILRATGHQILI